LPVGGGVSAFKMLLKMKTNRILLLASLFILGHNFTSFAQKANFSKDELILLKAVLETALVTEKNLPDYNSLPNKNEVYLLDKMISMDDASMPSVYLVQKQIPQLKTVKIKLITEAELKDSTRQEDILFIRLGQFNLPAEKEQPAIINIMGQWALGKESRNKGFVSKISYGNAMGFKRIKKGWEFIKTYYTFQNEFGL
jgi:hypothetical protein